MFTKSLVLFDIDGTLVRKAGPLHRDVLVEAAHRITGIRTRIDNVPTQGMLDGEILRVMLANEGASRALIQRHMPQMFEHAQRIYTRRCGDLRSKVCPGARMLLYRLSRRGVTTGLVTGNLTRIGWKKMECAGLKKYLRYGAFAERGKTRAELVRIAVKQARAEGWIDAKSPVALIGDHPNDVLAAKANGVRSIAVATGVVSAEELAEHQPDVLVADLRSLSMEELFG